MAYTYFNGESDNLTFQVYLVIWDESQISLDGTIEDYDANNWDDYSIDAEYIGAGRWKAEIPSTLPPGNYTFDWRVIGIGSAKSPDDGGTATAKWWSGQGISEPIPSTSTNIASVDDVYNDLGITTPTTQEVAVVAAVLIRAQGAVKRYLRYDPTIASVTEYHPQQPFQSQISRGIWEVMEQRAVLRQVAEAATNELQLYRLPVRGSPTAIVYVDYDGRSESRTGSFPSTSLKTIGQDFWPNYDMIDSQGLKVCRDGILRTIGLWPTTPGTVKITYTGGYTQNEIRGADSLLDASPIWETVVEEAVRRARKILSMKKGKIGIMPGVMSSESLGDYSYSIDVAALNKLISSDLSSESKERLSEFVNWGTSLGS